MKSSFKIKEFTTAPSVMRPFTKVTTATVGVGGYLLESGILLSRMASKVYKFIVEVSWEGTKI